MSNKRLDILIINPGAVRHNFSTEHLGIAGLKSYVNSIGFSADTLDMAIEGLTVSEATQLIINSKPRMLGLSLLDDSREKGLALAKAVRKAGYDGKIVAGGYFPTFHSGALLRDFPQIDFIVRGEGELTLGELLSSVFNPSDLKLGDIKGLTFRQESKIIENPARPLIRNLDILPPADRKYTSAALQKGSQIRISSSRGCWGQCTYCDIIGFYRGSAGKVWRQRSIPNLLDEIERLIGQFKTTYFFFNDDQFLLKGKRGAERAEEFAAEIIHRGLNIRFELMCRADTIERKTMQRLKEAGLSRVFLGLESFVDNQLLQYRKGITVRQNLRALITLYQLKIDVIASIILANAHTTLREMLQQFIALFELRKRYFNSPNCRISINNRLEVYRGSAIYQEYKSKGLLTRDNYLTGYEYRLKFGPRIRLGLFRAEEQISRGLLHLADVVSHIYKLITWQISKPKAYVSSLIKSAMFQIINSIKWY
jgi:radical SAM superfamily enzyme YgiQ (UPF0313 family)